FLRVLFEAHLPIGVDCAPAVGKIGKDAGDLAILRHPPQPYIRRVRKRHQHGHAVAPEAQKIKPFERGSEAARADIFDGPNTLVVIDNFVADLKSHTKAPHLTTEVKCRCRSCKLTLE